MYITPHSNLHYPLILPKKIVEFCHPIMLMLLNRLFPDLVSSKVSTSGDASYVVSFSSLFCHCRCAVLYMYFLRVCLLTYVPLISDDNM